jgi:flap endonuclease-1
MGIKNLNRYFIEKCSGKSIRKTSLENLRGKKIAIDISIYLYKFLSEGSLMEQMYMMISVLLDCHITPIFVFDGKTPPEKRALVHRRRLEKKAAAAKYADICNGVQPQIPKTELRELERKMIRLKWEDMDGVRDLLSAYGVCYIRANGEADHLCAQMAKNGEVWATLTDDMDLFLYDCPRIIRGLNLQTREIILYDTADILSNLGISNMGLLLIMVLFGTDYNEPIIENMKWINIDYLIKSYDEYTRDPEFGEKHFYHWLNENDKNKIQINEETISILKNTCEIFLRKLEPPITREEDNIYNKMEESKTNWFKISQILRPYGFVFLE